MPMPAAAVAAVAAAVGPWTTIGDGSKMPTLSLGTCCGSSPQAGLRSWLDAGGVGIDTSIDYHDEAQIGTILRAAGKKRGDVYITTKVTAGCGKPADCTADPAVALASVNQSLQNLGVDYIDLMLLHRPCEMSGQKCGIGAKLENCTGTPAIVEPAAREANSALWQGLQQAKAAGLVRSIGVSNYFPGHLAALPGEAPAVNQCEMSVEGHDDSTIAYCQSTGTVYQAYGAMRGCPFTDPGVAAIAAAHNASAAQVCLRWALQHGVVIAAGTGNDATKAAAYAADNLGVFGFELTPTDMTTLDHMQL